MQRVNIIRFQAYRNLISWISSFCYTALLSVFLDTTGTELRLADLLFCKTGLGAKKVGDRCRGSCFRDMDSIIVLLICADNKTQQPVSGPSAAVYPEWN